MTAIIRSALLTLALLAATILLVTHGIRGIVILIALVLAVTIPNTRLFRIGERWLVRLTGSRQRALLLVFVIAIALAIGVNVYEYVR